MICFALRRHVGGIAAALLAPALLIASPAAAVERLHRIFDQRQGLPTDAVSDVTQDAAGFLWIATPAGLVRFDGDEMRPWGGTARSMLAVRASATGRVMALDADGVALRVDPAGTAPLIGPDDRPVEHAIDLRFGPAGTLWIVRASELLREAPDGRWLRLPQARFDGELLRHVRADGAGQALVLTSEGIWSVTASGNVRRLLTMSGAVDALHRPDGSLMVLRGGDVMLAANGDVRRLLEVPARGIELLRRRRTVWVAFDRYIAQLAPGKEPVLIGAADGLPSGGHMLVDREDSLWVCSFRGLVQFPEPDTVAWSEHDGLPSTHARFLGRNREGVWVSTWAGLSRLVTTPAGMRVTRLESRYQGDICLDADGGLWFAAGDLYERRAGATRTYRWGKARMRFCTPAQDGTMWLGVGDALVRAAPGRLQQVAGIPPVRDGVVAPLLEDRSRRLWLGYRGRVCAAAVAHLQTPQAWRCESLPATVEPVAMVEVGETLWLGTAGDGVFRRTRGGWQPIAASRSLGGGRIFKLRPGANGTVWILSLGMPTRVIDRPGSAQGWEVVEVLSAWHGQPSGGASDLIEDPDGGVWTAGAAGVVHVPGEARREALRPPPIRLGGAFVDGRRIAPGEALRLVHRQNLLELRFAALTFRDRTRVRYQVRLTSGDRWTDLLAGEPVFRFPELPVGRYRAEIRATIDGRQWSDQPAHVSFRVRQPWYLQPWLLATGACALMVLILALQYVRLRVHLRLERQRTHIAMDLHDEIGSGLGSIGILAGIAESRGAGDASRAILREIAETTTEMSTSLGDIVWALRARSATLQEVIGRLAERGHRLLSESADFVVCAPECAASVRLGLGVQRNVLLIAVEALHNAGRHARAAHVELGAAPAGSRWRIWVSDDGSGFDEAAARTAGGLGLASMRRRAEEIGGTLELVSACGGGTTVSLCFEPAGPRRRAASRMGMRGAGPGV